MGALWGWCCQVKRIHEYKRQFLNVLGIIARYDQIKKMSPEQKAQVRAMCRLPAGIRLALYTCRGLCCAEGYCGQLQLLC